MSIANFADVIISQLRDVELGAWIGYVEISSNTWVWVDNSNVGFTNWKTGGISGLKVRQFI